MRILPQCSNLMDTILVLLAILLTYIYGATQCPVYANYTMLGHTIFIGGYTFTRVDQVVAS